MDLTASSTQYFSKRCAGSTAINLINHFCPRRPLSGFELGYRVIFRGGLLAVRGEGKFHCGRVRYVEGHHEGLRFLPEALAL